jgi:hypothetical protein
LPLKRKYEHRTSILAEKLEGTPALAANYIACHRKRRIYKNSLIIDDGAQTETSEHTAGSSTSREKQIVPLLGYVPWEDARKKCLKDATGRRQLEKIETG